MGFLDKVESVLDKGVSQAFRGGRGHIKEVEISAALRRECDNKARIIDRERTVVPNLYTVSLSPDDFNRFYDWAHTLADEMVAQLNKHAIEQGYSFVGHIVVSLTEDHSLRNGTLSVQSETERGKTAPVSGLSDEQRYPIVEIVGSRYALTEAKTIIGRGSDCDIIVEDTGVSRYHIEIRVTGAGVVVSDLGSTNGTTVDGARVVAPMKIRSGQTIHIGRLDIVVTLPEALAG
ncbi:FHA domain-containing protein [Micrococcales bacterium 31B]|nr:FHA domain-containing protein [Micrococcales bacterium 31B]